MVETGVTWCLTTQNMDVHQQRIEKITSWYDRWFNCGCISVEKQWDSNTIKSELFLLELRMRKPKYLQRKLIFWPTLKIMRHSHYNIATGLAFEMLPALLKGYSTVFLCLKSLPIQVNHQLKTATHSLLCVYSSVSHKQYIQAQSVSQKF